MSDSVSAKNSRLRKGIWASAFVAAVVVVVVILSLLYNAVANSITALSVKSMEELTLHDKQSITQVIETQWDILAGHGERFRYENFTSHREFMDELSKDSLVNTTDFGFVDSEGNVYTNKRIESKDESINSMCLNAKKDDNSGKFVSVYFNTDTTAEMRREAIIFGVQIKPFTVDNATFEFIFCRMQTSDLESKLKIDSYDGNGYSCIFDVDGYYVIRYNRSEDINTYDNFYTDLADFELKKGVDEQYIRTRIANGEIFEIEATVDGEGRLLRFSPVEDMNFYFVLNVSRSVFENQSRQLSTTILVYFIIMAIVSIAAIILLLYSRNSSREAKIEKQHKKELSVALMKAEDASIAKTAFLNNMSHDIRTPMNAIIGFTDLAIKYAGDKEKATDYLGKISNSSKHLLSLINDILDMSRIESGKTRWDLKPENIESVVFNIINMVGGEASGHGLTFETDVKIEHKNVLCDKLRLTQIMLNVISNAIKYTPSGGSVNVSFEEKPSEREGFAEFEAKVTDTGIGMSKEYLEVLFEPFTRENNSTVSGIQGTGLGMAITKNLVDMIDGTIDVKSEQGVGTTFTVTFDFEITEAVEEEKTEKVEVKFNGERILLAEDNELNREIAVELLSDAGLEIECAENGRQAVDMLVEKGAGYYDLILMDVQMPVLDGYAATKEIRGLDNKKLAEIPIIAMTANTFKEDVQAALDAGMDGHIGKPIDVSALMDAINKNVKR